MTSRRKSKPPAASEGSEKKNGPSITVEDRGEFFNCERSDLNVSVEGLPDQATTTDTEGVYRFNLPAGTYQISLVSDKHFPAKDWNVYCFQFSDGDNWGEDNRRALQMLREKLDAKDAVVHHADELCVRASALEPCENITSSAT